jgi:hypothetical protein
LHPAELVGEYSLVAGNLQRLGAVSGIVFFVLVFTSFFTPETPDEDDPTAEIVSTMADDRSGHLVGVYIGGLASLLFLVFLAALWSRLRAAEADRGASILVALGGLGTTVIVLVANTVFFALVDAADAGREPAAVRALFELDQTVLLAVGWTSAAFYLGVALSSLATGSLPRLLGWVAAVLVVAFAVGWLGIFSEDDEGGALGALFFIALLVNFFWILAASIVMLRSGPAAARVP